MLLSGYLYILRILYLFFLAKFLLPNSIWQLELQDGTTFLTIRLEKKEPKKERGFLQDAMDQYVGVRIYSRKENKIVTVAFNFQC